MGLSRGRLRRRGLGALSHEERAHLFDELLGVEGLIDVVIGAHLRTPGLIVGAVLAREQDHAGRGGFPLDLLAEIVAAGPGQEGVEQDDRGPVHPKFLERLVRAPGELGLEILSSEGDFEHLAKGFAVVDSQQLGGHECSCVGKDKVRRNHQGGVQKCQGFHLLL